MKTRNGFVSNSSASSFIIPKESGLLTVDVATQVFDTMVREYDDWGDSWSEAHKMTYDTARAFLRANQGYDGNILIPWTTNYETWIFRNSTDQICVDTCNNIGWNDTCFYDEGVQSIGEGHGIREYNFVPIYREFLDFDDMVLKRKSRFENEYYEKLGRPTGIKIKEGRSWKDYGEDDY